MTILMLREKDKRQFVECQNPPVHKASFCHRENGVTLTAVVDDGSVRRMLNRQYSAKELLSFIIWDSSRINRRWRDRYMREMIFCFHSTEKLEYW